MMHSSPSSWQRSLGGGAVRGVARARGRPHKVIRVQQLIKAGRSFLFRPAREEVVPGSSVLTFVEAGVQPYLHVAPQGVGDGAALIRLLDGALEALGVDARDAAADVEV